jgi:hypothetical protein
VRAGFGVAAHHDLEFGSTWMSHAGDAGAFSTGFVPFGGL